jgi:hypothetical protein
MKLAHAAIASILILAPAGTAFAQQDVFTSPDECMNNALSLDANGDGFLDAQERIGNERIQTNVDTNGDGRISQSEMTVLCNSATSDALQPDD